MNAIEFLINEHNKVRMTFANICDESDDKIKKQLCDTLCQDLLVHEKMEQNLWYPNFRDDPRITDEVKHLMSEERSAEKIIKMLDDTDSSEEWHETFLKFKADVEHHAREEEEKLFPRVVKMLTDEELNDIGNRMYAFKKEHTPNAAD